MSDDRISGQLRAVGTRLPCCSPDLVSAADIAVLEEAANRLETYEAMALEVDFDPDRAPFACDDVRIPLFPMRYEFPPNADGHRAFTEAIVAWGRVVTAIERATDA